jgi:murein DD-endopeptidase MepM/ murein hydrolase activator NlpD
VGDVNLLHLGADVGWYRTGEPVFAVANGIVRMSQGTADDVRTGERAGNSEKDKTPSPQPSPRGRGGANRLAWGNLVVIEHRSPNNQFVTTIYGHLANDRLVKAGDVVRAGQQIGTIGTSRVNGGYKPHMHLGVRAGRIAEAGRKMIDVAVNGKALPLQIVELRDDTVVFKASSDFPERLRLNVNGRDFEIVRDGDTAKVESAILWNLPSNEFPIVGYGLSTEGWLDPVAFLRSQRADINPAAFELVDRRRKRERSTKRKEEGDAEIEASEQRRLRALRVRLAEKVLSAGGEDAPARRTLP